MLVLSRKVGESIHVGDDVRVTLVRISDGSVRIGFTAPKSMNIVREELVPLDEQELAEAPDYRLHPIQENEKGINELGRRR